MPRYKVTWGSFFDKNGILHGKGSKVEIPEEIAEYYGYELIPDVEEERPPEKRMAGGTSMPLDREGTEVGVTDPSAYDSPHVEVTLVEEEEEEEPVEDEEADLVDPKECPQKTRHGVFARTGETCPDCGYEKAE